MSGQTVSTCPMGGPKCPEAICDCFLDLYPEDPLGLHPEAFLVSGHQYTLEGHAPGCPGCEVSHE